MRPLAILGQCAAADSLHYDVRYNQTVESRIAAIKQGLDFDSSDE